MFHRQTMARRHAIDVVDPAVARQHAHMELRSTMGPVTGSWNPGHLDASIRESVARKFAAALQAEGSKLRAREEERRRRDPTYRPDAIELNTHDVRAFDAYIDYYLRLESDEFASSLELKQAHKRLSLKLHPDKQHARAERGGEQDERQRARVKQRFFEMNEAYAILSDLATR